MRTRSCGVAGVVGRDSGKDFVEEDAEGVDVAGGGDVLAAGLLGAGVMRGHHRGQGDGGVARGMGELDDFGDAEIEELGLAVGGDEDVGGLDVAVDDAGVVGALDGGADFAEEAEAVVDGKVELVAELADGLSGDVLHDEVREPFGSGAGVEEGGDVVVTEGLEDAALVVEAAEDGGGVHAALDDFDGEVARDGGVADAIHRAHAAFTDALEELIAIDAAAEVDVRRRLWFLLQIGAQKGNSAPSY